MCDDDCGVIMPQGIVVHGESCPLHDPEPVTLGERLMPGCKCGKGEYCRCD